MAYDIKNIENAIPESNKQYFFDANVWLIILKPSIDLKPYEKNYVTFADKLFDWQEANPPKVVINSLVISEVINAYLRNQFDVWKAEIIRKTPENNLKEAKELQFKKDFRITHEYEQALKECKNDLLAYKEFCINIDNLKEPDDLWRIIKETPSNSDFNDYFYYEMALDFKFSIVTNDGDFLFSGVEILSANNKLLKHS